MKRYAILFFSFLLLPQVTRANTFFPEIKTVLDKPAQESQYLNDDKIRIEEPVFGDLFCYGVHVEVNAPVYGDIICAAKELFINANVKGDLRIAALHTSINGSIGERATIFSETLVLKEKARVLNEWAIWTQRLTHNLLPDESHRLQLRPIFGRKSTLSTEQRLHDLAKRFAISVASALALAFFAGAIAPQRIQQAYQLMLEKRRYAILWGAWLATGLPVASLLFILTVIGIPIGFALMALWIAFVYSAQVLAGGLIGYLLLRRFHPKEQLMTYAAPAIGIPLLWGFYLIPGIGWFIRVIAICIGFAGIWYLGQKNFEYYWKKLRS